MKVARGEVHTYLGMTLDFATPKLVKVTMIDYVDEIIELWDKACSELDDGYKVILQQHPTTYSRYMEML